MFSIIIPARLNSEMLKNTLVKTLDQTFQNFEIIVILDFENENLIQHEKIKYIFSGIKSPGQKRNLGINTAQGEYLAFLDDDAFPDKDWLSNALDIFQNNLNLIGVCGPSITPLNSNLLEKISGYIYESYLTSGPSRYRHIPEKHRLVDDYPSVNLIIKKEAVREVGGFDEKYWPGEDTKFCLDLTLKYGKKIYYSPLLIVNHYRRSVFHPHLIQVSRYAKYRGFFAKKFPQTSFRISYFVPTLFLVYLFYFPFVFFIFPKFTNYYLIPLILYLIVMAIDTTKIYSKSRSMGVSLLAAIGIFLSNVTYGIFFVQGLVSKPDLILREVDIVNEKYIKG